jgi:hypothetical protein
MDCGHNYYSIILKGCSRRESLGRRLESVLLRGRLAIKMALDSIPSVIIYKGKTDSILPILDAFKAEYAAITVIADGVPTALPLNESYPDYAQLNPAIQALLSFVPDKLWLGEKIYHISPARFADEDGALVISSHAVYFIDKPAGYSDCRWLIIAYSQLTGAPKTTAPATLTIAYQDVTGVQNSVFTVEPQLMESVTAAIHQARAAKKYLTRIKTICLQCGHMAEDYADTMINEERCRACGGQYQRTVL